MARIQFHNLKFHQIMKDYAQILEVTLPEAVRLNARLLAVEFSRRTQPFGHDEKIREQGEKAISTDLLGGKRSVGKGKGRRGIFAPITPFMESYAEFYDTGTIWLFARKNGTVYGTDTAHFLPQADTSTLRGIHKGAYSNGRMSAAGGDTRDIGRWKFINRYFVPPDTLKEYMASVKAKVGLAKSGWASCAKQIKNTRLIPTWVTRHLKDYALGEVEDKTMVNGNPVMRLTNRVKYASEVLRFSEQLQGQSIVSTKMKKQMETILKKRQLKLQEAA
jgi:hypothetical protein